MTEAPRGSQLHAAEVTTREGVVLARLVGPGIEEHRGEAIVAAVRPAIEQAGDAMRFLVLDFAEVRFINSSGLASCIALRNELNDKGVVTIAYRLSDDLLAMFRNVKIAQLFQIAATPAELEGSITPS